jgi:hypothetical protein
MAVQFPNMLNFAAIPKNLLVIFRLWVNHRAVPDCTMQFVLWPRVECFCLCTKCQQMIVSAPSRIS